VVTGKVKKARELTELLGRPIEKGTILVVPALEPSWAVVFGRVDGVVAEIGGELSHAAILLREAHKPAVVNCDGAFFGLSDGDRVRLDGPLGLVERIV